MASDPLLDEITATTLTEIYPDVLQDEFFRGAPALAYFRDHSLVPFDGGSSMQFDYTYAPLIGGFYATGATFDTSKPQTISAAAFDVKKAEVNITEYLEDLRINNRGPLAVFSMVDTDLRTAMNTMNAIWDIAMYRHGQAAGGAIVDNRPKAPNGWSEILNDGVTNSWDGNVFTAYGNQTRNGAIGAALNGNIYWCGDQSGNTGQITYAILLQQILRARRGNEAPDLGLTNKAAFAFMLERLQTQQRFGMEQDVIWGASGIKVMSTMFLVDDYCPSATSQFGVNDAQIGNYSTSSFTSVAAPTSGTNLPASTSCTVGELILLLNTKKVLFRVVNDELFGFGFKPFIMSADNTRVSGQILAGANLQYLAPWSGSQLYGIGS